MSNKNSSILKYFIYPIFLLGSIGICSNLFSQTANFDSLLFSKDRIPLITVPDFQIWVDSQDQITSLLSIPQQNFQTIEGFELGSTKSAYWFRFSLENPTAAVSNYWLNTSVFDSLTLLQFNADTLLIQHRGLLVVYDEFQKERFQNLQENKYGFDIPLPPKSKTEFYLRIKNIVRFESNIVNISLQQNNQAYRIYSIWFLIFNTLFFSVLLFLTLFTLLQFIQNRDAAYWYYSQYLIFCIGYFWWKFEKANSFINIFFTDWPNLYYYWEIPCSIAIYISYLFFVIHFINAKKEIPLFYKFLKISSIIWLVYLLGDRLLVYFIDYSWSWEIYYGFRLIKNIIGIYAIYLVFKSRHQLAFYLLSGSFIVLLGSIGTAYLSKTMSQHYEGSWDIPLLPIQIAILIEVFFFSVGLGYKSRLVEREKTKIFTNLKLEQKEKTYQKQKKEQLTRWFTNISHEFRTPLTVILGTIQKISGHSKEKAIIQRNSQQLLHLVNKVLDLHQLEAAKMQLTWVRIDVMHYLRVISESFELLASTKKQQLTILCQPNQLVMDVDKEKLQQIIGNLLSNAIKFTPEKGQISLHAFVEGQNGNRLLKIKVKDSGIGIPPAYQTDIFAPYTQLPNTEGGSGIGLALVKELLHLLGGSVRLDSRVGKGSQFILSLPIRQRAALAPNASVESPSPIQSPIPITISEPIRLHADLPTLLLVEDNQDILQYIGDLLNPHYTILTAHNGKEGLEKAFHLKPDIIVSDIMMPELDGFSLCKKLKEKNCTKGIPIVLVTAKASSADRLKALSYQADAYLVKPFKEQELLLQLAQLIKKKRYNANATFITAPPLTPSPKKEAIEFMHRFHQLVEENIAKENFKVKDLCAALAINHVSLNNKIKEITGKTTAKYLRHYRLTKARRLLETTDLTTAEIAWQVGIAEASNFSNMFKKAFGVSPKMWKNT